MEAYSRGHRIAFTVEGDGPPLVLVPGLMMSAQRWVDCGYVAALADSATVITIDPLGHGASSRPTDPRAYTYPEVAEDLVAVLDRLSVEAATWWGYSRGGMLAGCVATEFPHRVRSLVAGGATLSAGRAFLDALGQRLAPLLRDGGWPAFWPKFPVPEPTQRLFERTNDPSAIAAVLEGGVGYDGDAARITCPTFLYAGGDDPAGGTLELDAELVGAKTHIFPGLDHAGAFQAADLVLPVVKAHL